MKRLRRVGLEVCVVLLCTAWALPVAFADSYKSHGEFLHTSGKYKVVLLEMDGWINIRLVGKERGAGGPVIINAQRKSDHDKVLEEIRKRDRRLAEDGPIIREENEIDMAWLRSEVIQTAEPNYVSNPGHRYRIYVVGGAIAPMYFRQFEVGAANARDEVWGEAFKLYSQVDSYSLDQEALYYGFMLAIEALHSSDRMPAFLPLTLLRSTVGMFRIGGEEYARRKVGRTQRFASTEEGQGFFRTIQDEDELANVRSNLGPRYKRGLAGSPGSVSAPGQRRDNARDFYRENTNRAQFQERQTRGPQDIDPDLRVVERGKPLTAVDKRLEPLSAANRRDVQDMELLKRGRDVNFGRDTRFNENVGR